MSYTKKLEAENAQLRKQLSEALSAWITAQDLAYQRLVLLHIHCPEQVKKTP